MKKTMLVIALLGITLVLSGCVKQKPINDQNVNQPIVNQNTNQQTVSDIPQKDDNKKIEPQNAMSPYIEFEGTVISLSPDQLNNYLEGDRIIGAPDDSAVIRIDNILETGGSTNFNWSSLGIERGGETSLHFKYTTRPIRIITVVGETSQNGDTASRQIVPTQITLENGQFVFRINGNSATETTLPGLQVGSRFRTKLWNTSEVKIEQYEILN